MIYRLLFILFFLSKSMVGQVTQEYDYFEMDWHAKISNYYYEDSVLVVDFRTLYHGSEWSYGLNRTFILPENQHLIKLPSKFGLFSQRIFKTGKEYNIKVVCPQERRLPDWIVARYYIEKYDVWIRNDDFMPWHVCELVEIDVID